MESKLVRHIEQLVNVPDVHLVVVDDGDGLLMAEESAAALMAHHVTLVPLVTPLELRHLYESRYRGHQMDTTLVVVTRTGFSSVPLEILSSARRVELSLGLLFPHLDVGTLQPLPFSVLSRLYDAYDGMELEDLSQRETLRVVSEKGYGIAAESVSTTASLYATLLRLHLGSETLPEPVASYIVGVWRKNGAWQSVPLERLVRHRRAFLEYLQRHWNAWVASQIDGRVVASVAEPELAAAYGGSAPPGGIPVIPWESVEVRTLADDYFDMGLLDPVHAVGRGGLPEWAACGVVVDEEEHMLRRLTRLRELLATAQTGSGVDTAFWNTIAPDVGSLLAQFLFVTAGDHVTTPMSDMLAEVDGVFGSWVFSSYDAALATPYLPRPHAVHQIAPYLSLLQPRRLALVVMDGMNWWQWRIITGELATQGIRVEDVSSVLACIPTITGISRAAIFAGNLPRSFLEMSSPTAEAELWQQFWTENGLSAENARLDIVGPTSSLTSSLDNAYPSVVRAFGAVVPRVDELIHNVGLSQKMFAAAVKTWAAQGELAQYLKGLLDFGYDVYVTADHGNTSARGIGVMGTGVLAEQGGKRMRIFGSSILRDAFVAEHPDNVIGWDSASLPQNLYAALCKADGAFAPVGEVINCHGGISLLETVVPFARIVGE